MCAHASQGTRVVQASVLGNGGIGRLFGDFLDGNGAGCAAARSHTAAAGSSWSKAFERPLLESNEAPPRATPPQGATRKRQRQSQEGIHGAQVRFRCNGSEEGESQASRGRAPQARAEDRPRGQTRSSSHS